MLADAAPRADAVTAPRRVRLPKAVLRLGSDETLVGQLRAGSDAAFEVLFDRHHGHLLAFCRHMLGSRAEAEDVVQDTFLSAYRDAQRAALVLSSWASSPIRRSRAWSAARTRR